MAPAPTQPATAPARTGSIPKSGQPARSSGPLSLDPQAQASVAPPPPSARDRAASAPPPPAVPAQDPPPPRLASAPANVGTGGYAVQLSSQKSEAEAQSSFRSLQAKFPDQLGNRSPIVRRADLGDKGIYYRAMVGPFGSADEAGRFCSGLKAAGGQCLIQKN
jgi:cell division septation protein DedD